MIASGWPSGALAMRLAVDAVLPGSGSCASPGIVRIRWPAPVRPGDAPTLTAASVETRRSRSRPDLGILPWVRPFHHPHGQEVLDLQATRMSDLADATGDAS